MTSAAMNDFEAVWERAEDVFALGAHSLHGPDHWRRVEAHGLEIAARSGADLTVVRLFAALHDSMRWTEGGDLEHGHRAAELAAGLQGDVFQLDDKQLELLLEACRHHNLGRVSSHPTIGCCWDADRLDLPRVGIQPDPRFMSTAAGRSFAQNGEY
jgi:uncharacterized protein